MNTLRIILTGMILVGWIGQAQANGYWGVGGSLINFDDGADEIDPKNGLLRLGYEINQHFEIGGEISLTLISDEFEGVDFDVDSTFFYIKLNAVLDGGNRVYVMAGPTDVELTGSSGGVSISADDSDTGIGLGFQIKAASGGYWAFDYIRYFDDDGVEVTGLNFSYLAYF